MALTKASIELPSEESVLGLDALVPLPWLVLSPLLEDSVDMFELVDVEYPSEEDSAASGVDGRSLRHVVDDDCSRPTALSSEQRRHSTAWPCCHAWPR